MCPTQQFIPITVSTWSYRHRPPHWCLICSYRDQSYHYHRLSTLYTGRVSSTTSSLPPPLKYNQHMVNTQAGFTRTPFNITKTTHIAHSTSHTQMYSLPCHSYSSLPWMSPPSAALSLPHVIYSSASLSVPHQVHTPPAD
jgi:hypothetical protein